MTFLQKQAQELAEYKRAYVLAASASLGSVFVGWDIGLIGGVLALNSFQEYFGLDKKSSTERAHFNGNVVSVLQAGCFFGALCTGYLSSQFGRKPSLIASGVIFLIGSSIQSVAGIGTSQEVGLRVLYFSRFLGGFGVGMVSTLVPYYVSECTPKAIRGRCTGMCQLANNIGIMLSFWVNYGASKDIPSGEMQWRIPFIMQMVPGIMFVIAMLFLPESPRWLVEHKQYERAAMILGKTSGKNYDDPTVTITLEEIKQEFFGQEKLSIVQQCRRMGESRPIALRCIIPPLVAFLQQWTGTNAINYYSPQIFESLGIEGTTAELFATGVYGIVKTASVALVLAVAVESFGRKRCLITGGLGQGAMMLWIGGYSGINTTRKLVLGSYVSILAVYLYAMFYSIGWGPIPWVVASEVAPNHLRPALLSITVGVNWLLSLTISKVTPLMLDSIKFGTFLVFGFCCLIITLWAYACLPETTGIALEDIKYLFEQDVIVRSLQDAPGGKIFLRGKSARSVESLKKVHIRESEEALRGEATPVANLDTDRSSLDTFSVTKVLATVGYDV